MIGKLERFGQVCAKGNCKVSPGNLGEIAFRQERKIQ